jgi:hypothetical protein
MIGSGVIHFENAAEGTMPKPVFSQVPFPYGKTKISNESLVFMACPVVRMQLKNTVLRMAAANLHHQKHVY